MKPSKELANKIIDSLKNEPEQWDFNGFTAENNFNGFSLWTTNTPIISIHLHSPKEVSFSLIDRFRLYRALKKGERKNIIKLIKQWTIKK